MFKKFLPKQHKFFKILLELSQKGYEGADILNQMLSGHENLAELSSKIHLLENKCDDLTHEVINELNETFITPIDREDIYALTNSLDNIIDSIDAIGTRLSVYKLIRPIPYASQLSDILLSQIKLLVEVVGNLQAYDDIFHKLVSIRNLETEGDTVFRDSLSDLFEHEKDVIELIKKKEILENIEKAVDRCQTATIVIEGILIKNV